MKIAITTESTCDLTEDLIKNNDIHVIPLTVLLGEKSGADGIDIKPLDIFDFVDKNKQLPRTCAVNEYQYEQFFSSLLEKYDGIVHISLSSSLSSSCSNATNVARTLKNVYVVDSKTVSTGIGLQVLYACQLRDKGLDAKEIAEKVENRRKYIQTSFFVDTIDYLYKGGRCSMLAMLGAVLLRIKPQIISSMSEGTLVPGSKFFGRKTAVCRSYCLDILEKYNNPDKSLIFLTHSYANEEVIKVAYDILKENGFENIQVTIAGSTISSHCGKASLGILYYNDGGKEF